MPTCAPEARLGETPPVRLKLGKASVTRAALEVLTTAEIHLALDRHRSGDWGAVSAMEWKRNNQTAITRGVVVSSFTAINGERFAIKTDVKCGQTLVYLP